MGDNNTMQSENMDDMVKNDEKFAAMLQKQFDEEESMMFNRDGRSVSPDLIAHPASPIEERLSSFADSSLDPAFEEQISAQLLKHINSSGAGTSQNNGIDVYMEEEPSSSNSRQADDLLSEEYARRLQEEFDNESKLMSLGNSQATWDPISEWRIDDDEALNRALRASLLDHPSSSKRDFQWESALMEHESDNSSEQFPHHSKDENKK